MPMRKEITISNRIDELRKVEALVEEISRELHFDTEMKMNIGLALEETVSNVICYAHPQGTEASITLIAESDGHELTFVVSDQGRKFDPTLSKEPDIDISPAEREIGGMGIFIVKNIMNEVTYQRLNGKNLLTMKKRLNKQ